jgi:hypothetical protein
MPTRQTSLLSLHQPVTSTGTVALPLPTLLQYIAWPRSLRVDAVGGWPNGEQGYLPIFPSTVVPVRHTALFPHCHDHARPFGCSTRPRVATRIATARVDRKLVGLPRWRPRPHAQLFARRRRTAWCWHHLVIRRDSFPLPSQFLCLTCPVHATSNMLFKFYKKAMAE